MRWYGLDPDKVIVLTEVTNPTLGRVDEGGQRPSASPLPEPVVNAIRTAAVVLVCDYGQGTTAVTAVRDLADAFA